MVSALLFDFLGRFSFVLWVFFLFYFFVFFDGFLLGFQPLRRQKDTENQTSHSFILRLNDSVGSRCDVPLPESSHLDVSPPSAESLGTHVGGHKVAVAHAPRSAEEVSQAVSHAGGSVAGSLLCCNAASGEETRG